MKNIKQAINADLLLNKSNGRNNELFIHKYLNPLKE